ncbi:RNA polymerase sigma-54 factor [Peribacillus deserti]|uniref:RNA polymerase sigma-54 factor n=1 Tax=Peribacillus deserti TaxID=673318 RepID=A0ABS2QCV0_9BACI|nr:RNA polymerase factor sigma-54 [Peribacillus deserti]MBM7690982.1 RNA polymerase sigma-54 factor [Peribacillus deserti]
MELRNGLFQQQSLKLSMTQELSQAIALLQYTSQELAAYLEERAAENPLVSLDSSPEGSFAVEIKRKNRLKAPREKDAMYWLEQIGDQSISLSEYLRWQLSLYSLNHLEKKVMNSLILNLDQNGYLRASLEDIAEITGCESELVEKCLCELQMLEPAGIGARNLQECLLLQSKRMQYVFCHTETILRDHFLLFAEKKWKELARKLDISLKDIQDVQDFVLTLNPRPGASFQQEKSSYVVPDVKVEYLDGVLQVRLPENHANQWDLNQSYFDALKSYRDQSVDKFLHEKWQEFQWISKSLQQRKETILKVTKQIVKKQERCFLKGLGELKPMTMREVAEELGIHESTVSRTVREKYVQAPFGTVELRAFFTSNLQSVSSDDISAVTAKKELHLLVESEDKTKPLSDQDISVILKMEKGIILSRRTVAKYREQLGIPSSSKRKRYN